MTLILLEIGQLINTIGNLKIDIYINAGYRSYKL